MVGFVAALRRSELLGLDVTDPTEHPNGLVIELARSKTNQRGDADGLVILPRGTLPRRCSVTAVQRWREASNITAVAGGVWQRVQSAGGRLRAGKAGC